MEEAQEVEEVKEVEEVEEEAHWSKRQLPNGKLQKLRRANVTF